MNPVERWTLLVVLLLGKFVEKAKLDQTIPGIENCGIGCSENIEGNGENVRIACLENIEGKGENACSQHFLLFPQCFQPFQKQFLIFQSHLFCPLQMVSVWTTI